VARTTGTNWACGHKTYRNGEVVGFVPVLERLAVRQVSARFLSQDERIEIADLRQQGFSVRQIAKHLGRAPSTVSRELRRNATSGKGYRPFEAHKSATARRARRHKRRVEANPELRRLVAELLIQRWSPQQVSRYLRRQYPDRPRMRLCHESIYQAVYEPGSALLRPSPLAPHRRSPLRSGRGHRRAHQRVERRRPRFEKPMLTIHDRHSGPKTAQRQDTGRETSSSVGASSPRSAPSSSARPATFGFCICPDVTVKPCTRR
jgi:IS30 family transposase